MGKMIKTRVSDEVYERLIEIAVEDNHTNPQGGPVLSQVVRAALDEYIDKRRKNDDETA